jgi:para-nitrobenzyl esterase
MRKIVSAVMLAALMPAAMIAVPAVAEAPAAPAAAAKYAVETTDLGTLMDDPAAKAVLEKHLPGLVGNAQIQMARGLSLKQLQQFAGDMVTDAKLADVQLDLDKLPAK